MPKYSFKTKAPKGGRLTKRTLSKLKKDVAKLKKATEYKYIDSERIISMTSTSAIADLGLGSINQGDGPHNRDGSEIMVSSIKVKGYINYADSVNKYRLMIIKVRDVDHLTPITLGDILETPGNFYNSFYKKNSVVSYSVLKDIRGWLNKPGYNGTIGAYQATSNPTHKNFVCNLNFKTGLKVKYDVATPGNALPNTNGFYMILWSDSYIVGDHPDAAYTTRITFTE